ncbi:hypothetical protein T439DRAFT_355386 [Meredithblackwellia eburnea MCA 4105]
MSDPDIDSFIKILDRINAAKTYMVVMLAILVWDHLSTLPQEIRFVWKARITVNKVAFLVK